jgi:predicted dehydrogenase/threonine dehydrogenase-like Zn-dependent dehydrogenase
VKVVNSCISAGTELSRLQGSGRNIIQKALDQPEKVRLALRMVQEKGVIATLGKVMGRGDVGVPTGYSAAGVALAVGEGVRDIQPTDRVAVAGEAIASHAEYVDVPRNLVMRIPGDLDFRSAATVALGGIAMHGARRASVQIGEFVVVFGAGVIGQLAVQVLVQSGARVIAVDLDRRRLDLARDMGAELCLSMREGDAKKVLQHHTSGAGADVIIFCAATDDSEALSTAFKMARKKGRVVMVGSWGRELKREDIYAKELDFLISTSYGSGRYDTNYELKGQDYPYAYVRWTENRNMEEYLRLLATGKIRVEPLIDAVYPLKEVEKAFNHLSSEIRPLMVLLEYEWNVTKELSTLIPQPRRNEKVVKIREKIDKPIRVAIIGAGGFATGVHLPNLKKLRDRYEVRAICNRTGFKAQALAQQFGAQYATTDYRQVLFDPDIDVVMICTRHSSHGKMVLESLEAGKNTFVEKPLCTGEEELEKIRAFYNDRIGKQPSPLLMVGFNRRFSGYAKEVKRHILGRTNPLFIHYRMNAGYIPLDHWVHSEEGGGRIIGEACHIIDLFSFLIDSDVRSFGVGSLRPNTGSLTSNDNKSIILEYEDGSLATLEYFAVGSKEFPKEFLEVHFDEKSIIVDDYKYIKGYGLKVADIRTRESDKGQLDELEILARYLSGSGDQWPISWESMLETTKITFQLMKM